MALLIVVLGALCSWCFARTGVITLYNDGRGHDTAYMADGRRWQLPCAVSYDELAPGKVYRSNTLTLSPRTFNAGGVVADVRRDPWGTGIVFGGYALFALGAACCLGRQCRRVRAARIAVATMALSALLYGWAEAEPLWGGQAFARLYGYIGNPLLASPMLCAHVLLIAVAYGLLIASVFNIRCLVPGVLLLGCGIALGSVWGYGAWGRYWGWDPKETWALITFAVYALPVHRRIRTALHQRGVRIYLAAALASLAMTFVGVNLFCGGLHSYL